MLKILLGAAVFSALCVFVGYLFAGDLWVPTTLLLAAIGTALFLRIKK
jgi:hypothetical protein